MSRAVPALSPSDEYTVSATSHLPEPGNLCEMVGTLFSSGAAPGNFQLYFTTPPGAVDAAASNFISLVPAAGSLMNVAVAGAAAGVQRCRHWCPSLLHSCWYQ